MTTFALPSPRALAQIPRWLIYAAAGALLAVAILTFAIVRSQATVRYATEPVAQQTLVQSVTASGTVNPQNNISVGTQVSGTIQTIDVDYNSKVKKGQVLARIDPSTFQAQLDQANAGLVQSQALAAEAGANANGAASGIGIAGANATAQQDAVAAARDNITKAQAALMLAQTTDKRDEALLAQGYVAQSTVDTDRSKRSQAMPATSPPRKPRSRRRRRKPKPASQPSSESGSTAQAQADARKPRKRRSRPQPRRLNGQAQPRAHRHHFAGRRYRRRARRLGRSDRRRVAADADALLDRAGPRQDGSRHQRRRTGHR